MTVDAPSAPVLRLHAACTRLPGRSFGPFDLCVKRGERIAILGPSGAGKSTLLRLIAGELTVHTGEVSFDARCINRWRAADLARRRGVLPQSHAVAFGMPVELVVSLGRLACGADHSADPDQAKVVAQALVLACASHLVGRRFDTLSGGEQARVQLARVFAQLWDVRAGLLLVDEPLAALDPGLQFDLMDALRRFALDREHALVAVLHDLNQALAGFERLWLVQKGQLVADLPADQRAVAALESLFGIGLRRIDLEDSRIAVLAQRAAVDRAGQAAVA